MKLEIRDCNGNIASYRGNPMRFDTERPKVGGMSERERAETILWLLDREAKGGHPFRLVELEVA